MNYKLINNITGWLSFAISLLVYTLTLEPTVSFWDCGEFISTSFKLQIPHPPGAPLFLMIGRLFSLFAGNDLSQVAYMVNFMSATTSALTVLFIFWTTTHFAKKLIVNAGEKASAGQLIAIMGAGLVGALACTFSDTFWFSAVEAEVYATSSFFSALVFWAILKWEESESAFADKWLILIAYIVGLAIGVHLLNLLVIPAIVYVFFFKKYPLNWNTFFKASGVAIAAIAIVQFFIIPKVPEIGAFFDRIFVNSFGTGFGTGVIFYIMLVTALIGWGLYYTHKNQKYLGNLLLLMLTFVLIGYSSYAMIVIRAQANPPINMNSPSDPYTLLSYLNREQYGDWPIFRGQYFTAKYVDIKEGKMQYRKGENKYEELGPKVEPVWDPAHTGVLPRMWSDRADHVSFYKAWLGWKEPIDPRKKPTFAENLDFAVGYQLGVMYWRYFFWNFVGRQNDEQGQGSTFTPTKGNWISGIDFIDNGRLGPQDNLPHTIAWNKGRNKYYFLPLLLGLAGILFQMGRNRKDSFVVLILFLFTGIFIMFYLNSPPLQPRERDYSYVGSFQTFCIFIGLGVLQIFEWLRKKIGEFPSASIAVVACLLLVPGIMAKENWDDHDRSNRYMALDFAKDYLESCPKNAILFTNGDNDTYPLWYAQNVENVRPDIRIINLSLLNTDWYTDQLKKPVYESPAVEFSMTPEQYRQGTRDYINFVSRPNIADPNQYYELGDMIRFMTNDTDPRSKVALTNGETMPFYPSTKFKITLTEQDKKDAIANGIVHPSDADKIANEITWDVGRQRLMKADLVTLDIIASNRFKRPICWAITTGNDVYLNLEPYFEITGLIYKLTPIRFEDKQQGETGRVQTTVMYDNFMNKFKFGNMDKPNMYMDGTVLRQAMNFRNISYRLATNLVLEGKKAEAVKVLDHCMQMLPEENVPYNIYMIRMVDGYYQADAKDKATAVVKRLVDLAVDNLSYYKRFDKSDFRAVSEDYNEWVTTMNYCQQITAQYGDKKLSDEIANKLRPFQGVQ